jgi:hypothetical protein
MKNKILIKLIVPELDIIYDVFIPVNEIVWKIKRLLVKSVTDLTNTDLNDHLEYELINKDNSKVYDNNELIKETDIRNGSELVLIFRNLS